MCRQPIIQETTKMPYKYSKIYNASQGKWASDVSGESNATKVWLDNEWEDGDAIVGFYSDADCDNYEVIYCDDGYAVYVLGEADKEAANFHFGPHTYRVPPVVLVNLNNTCDAVFLRKKSDPTWSDDCACNCDSESDAESDAMSEDSESSEDTKNPNGEWRTVASVSENQPIIDFLYRCRDATSNTFKRAAYEQAINYIGPHWKALEDVNESTFPQFFPKLTPNMYHKIREFLDAMSECDEEEAKNPNDVWRVCVPANQPIIDFLIRCCRGTTNTFKRRAYARAIIKIVTYWRGNLMEVSEYDLPRLLPGLSENMISKIREFIDGVPEEDIMNS